MTKHGELEKLERYFHDNAVSLRTAGKCGKKFIDLEYNAQILEKIEKLIIVLKSN